MPILKAMKDSLVQWLLRRLTSPFLLALAKDYIDLKNRVTVLEARAEMNELAHMGFLKVISDQEKR